MAEFPGFTIWTDAYLADTGHLSTLEHGAYLLILFAMWRAGGYLPNDDRRLARFSRLTDAQFSKIRHNMMEFFTVEGDQITQGRLLEELEKARSRSTKASENARAKYRKTNKVKPADALPKASEKPASISITIDTNKKAPAEPKKGSRIPAGFIPDPAEAEKAGVPLQLISKEAANFIDYWSAKTGKDATKLDWPATWRMWCRRTAERYSGPRNSQSKSRHQEHQDAVTRSFEEQINGKSTSDKQQPAFDLEPGAFRSDRSSKARN